MTISLTAFNAWAHKRITLKHNWFDRLADVVRGFPVGGDLPASLKHWRLEYDSLRMWIEEAVNALSPRQVLDLEVFDQWPAELLQFYRNSLHEDFLKTKPYVGEIVDDCVSELKRLNNELDPMLEPGGPFLDDEPRARIAGMLETISQRLRDLPDTVQWPNVIRDELPDILVIDDLLGRAALNDNGESALSPEATAQIAELRRSFCQRFRLLDADNSDHAGEISNPIARAYFSSGQRYEPESGFINDLDVVKRDYLEGVNGDPSRKWGLVVADVFFNTGVPDENGRGNGESRFGIEQIVPWLKGNDSELPIVALTTESGPALIKRVYELGVDYLHRSESSYVDMFICIARGERASVRQLKQAMHVPDDLIAVDPQMVKILIEAWNIAQDIDGHTVLIIGEPGAGKGRLAKYIHDMSPRRKLEALTVNCAHYSKELADSELFGYYAGAFTGAANVDTPGIFHKADKSTLVLDEFGDLDMSVQVKLLRTLEPAQAWARPVEPRGNRRQTSSLATKVNVRIICCTNQPLSQVRDDLRTRVGKVIEIPPLRERPDDIVALAQSFLAGESRLRTPGLLLDEDACAFLKRCYLPGNARTLQDLLKEARIGKGNRNLIRRKDLERAWESVCKKDPRNYEPVAVQPQEVSAPVSSSSINEEPISRAVSMILSSAGEGWRELSKADTDALDLALHGQVIQVISVLLEWSLFRGSDLPTASSYLTGQKSKHRAPEDLIRRLMKVDPRIVESIAQSPYLPANARLQDLIESCRVEWLKRKKAGAD